MSKQKKRNNSQKNDNTTKAAAKKIFIGALAGTALFFVLLLIFAFAVVKAEFSYNMQNILAFACACISAFFGAYISGRLIKKNGIAIGALTALPEIFLICVIMLIAVRDIGLRTLIMSALMILCGSFGGILAVNKRAKRKK